MKPCPETFPYPLIVLDEPVYQPTMQQPAKGCCRTYYGFGRIPDSR